ncbi:related to gibberellin cluster-kaurenoxidase (diterpencyclase) [Ramularia collo-cygni]|uniref:Related to gibberellin cluster-kaurenoxidase (Diterpencyclase) n=1 Tax=Ramularia collo-cygni TaxID=112498 RepID=A0A2D3V4G3_9PEZI|nr:related to gibberellin cluster-kaurenoxidase (diterpencyclase) [Ramularia collo-cygni]CZT16379.1 related to gibberellin cluster-kaurenoxidase (diterpencyclase) [Ramularia collo-cygni]
MNTCFHPLIPVCTIIYSDTQKMDLQSTMTSLDGLFASLYSLKPKSILDISTLDKLLEELSSPARGTICVADDKRCRWSALMISCILLAITITYLLGSLFEQRTLRSKIPVAGRGSFFVPNWWARLRFIRNSREIIQDGYSKYKDIFIIRKSGADIVAIGSAKLVDEVRAQTKDSARSVEIFLHDFVGSYTGGKVFAESDLQNRVLMQKVTPNLGALIPAIKDELEYAIKMELPVTHDTEWMEVDMLTAFPRIAARVVARILLGPEGCRDEEWLRTTAQYTQNVFLTGFALRFVPRIFRPLVAAILPTYWKLLTNLASARSFIGGLAEKRVLHPEDDVLQSIMDLAKPNEREADDLSQRMMVLSLAGIHTTAVTMAQAMYDLCARPQDFSAIRAELTDVLSSGPEWNKGMLLNLHKMDSQLKESQRFNPVFLLTFNRILPTAVSLSNGIELPAGTRVAVPYQAILNDPTEVPGENPASYDPWRYAKLREDPGNAQRHQFAMVDSRNMAFGYGKHACPGRFFLATEIKMIFAHMLMNFDWKLPEGHKRPESFTIDTDMYPDRSARVLIRSREVPHSLKGIVSV